MIGNITAQKRCDVALTFSEVSANTTEEQTVTVAGLATSDMVVVSKPTHQAGLGIVGARVSAADTLAVTWMNTTASGITPTAAETYRLFVIKAESPAASNAVI